MVGTTSHRIQLLRTVAICPAILHSIISNDEHLACSFVVWKTKCLLQLLSETELTSQNEILLTMETSY